MHCCRYNCLVAEREYSRLSQSKWLSWADLSISQGVGILLRPFSALATPTAGSGLIHTVTGLSLQYQTCWVILHPQDPNRYMHTVGRVEAYPSLPPSLHSLLSSSLSPSSPQLRARRVCPLPVVSAACLCVFPPCPIPGAGGAGHLHHTCSTACAQDH